ncbi:MAG: NmrA family NAD(P)-binding protein [Geminicoccaceae bacterium]
MAKPLILVMGATGSVGVPLVTELVTKGQTVRAFVRQRDARSEALEKIGAQIAVGDLYDSDQLYDALRGVRRAFYLSPVRPYMIQSAVAFAVAARDARLEHLVGMSQWTSHRAHPANMTRQTWLADELFGMIPGVAHTVFNPGMFAHNFLRTMDLPALLGLFPVLSGKGKAAPVSNEDMARTAAAILIEGPQRHASKSYRPTGPQLLDGREMAAIVARVVGHRVLPIDLPIWLLGKVARQRGIDPYEITSLRHYMQDMRKGTFAFEGGVTDVVRELTGTPAESFETTARRYAALPFARRTLANRLKALLSFNITPFCPGYDFDAWDRKMAIPAAPHPNLSIDDERWRRTHHAQMVGLPA